MPQMISLRTFRLASTSGHVVHFESKVPAYVAPPAVAEAMANGCVMADEADTPFFEDLERAKVEFSGGVRASMVYLAVKDIIDKNKTSEFDSGGVPRVPAVEDRLGFDVTKTEVVEVYKQYQQYASEGREYPLHPSSANILRVIDATTKAELVELADEFGVDEKKARGLTVKDLRKLLLVKFDGNAAGG